MKKATVYGLMLSVGRRKKVIPIYKLLPAERIELLYIALFGDNIFQYELRCQSKGSDFIVLRRGILSSHPEKLFQFHELEGIELDHSEYKLEIELDPYYGKGWIEITYKVLTNYT